MIRAIGVNHNGRSAGISHPSSEGQDALIRHVYEKAELAPQLTGYVECHGTGTAVGDPLEVAAVSRVFNEGRSPADEPLLIGSVKTNLGHSEAASAVTGIIKSVLAIERGMIPATIGVTELNPNIDFKTANVKVVTEMTPWPKSKLRRISVNSFGFGGANGHVILDHPDLVALELAQQEGLFTPQLSESLPDDVQTLGFDIGFATPPPSVGLEGEEFFKKLNPRTRRWVLLTFSAHDQEALIANVAALGDAAPSLPLADVAYTLSKYRSRLLHKSFAVVDSSAFMRGALETPTNIIKSTATQRARIGFVFTGQGAQWNEMGRALFDYPVFESSLKHMDGVLAALSVAPPWSLKDVLSGNSERSLEDAEISQAVCAALQIGIVDLLRSWNIVPHATVGHSSGEIAAAYASGRVSRSEAIVLAYCRSRAIASNSQKGAMLAVGLTENEVHAMLAGVDSKIKIAAVNSPRSMTLSGDFDAIHSLHERLQSSGTFSRLLQTGNNAYHSHHMLPIGEMYEDMLNTHLAEIKDDYQPTTVCSWVSSVTPGQKPAPTPRYWRDNLEGAVLFSPAVEHLVSNCNTQVDILVEIGPHSALQGPLKQVLSATALEYGVKTPVYLSALRRSQDGMQNILSLCGSLFQLNATLDLVAINSVSPHGGQNCDARAPQMCADMPTYQYTYGPPLYYESRITRELRNRAYLHHDLLGILRPGGSRDQPVWRNVLRIKDVPWLSHHRLVPNAVLPGSAYVGLVIEAASQHVRGHGNPSDVSFKIRNFHIKNALIVPDDEYGIEVMTSITTSSLSNNWFEFFVTSVDREGNWGDHAKGLITVTEYAADGIDEVVRLDDKLDRRYIDVSRWYKKFGEIGLGYGQSFQGLSNLTTDPYKDIAIADVNFNPTTGMFNGPESGYAIHPATLDACFQASIIALYGGQVGRVQQGYIPVFIEEMSIWPARSEDNSGRVVAHSERRGLRNSLSQIQVFDQFGLPRVEVKNLRGVQYDGGNTAASKAKSNEFTRLAWKPDISTLSSIQASLVIPFEGVTYPRLAGLVDLMGHRDSSMKILQIGLDDEFSLIILRTLGGHTDTLRYDTFALADKSDETTREAATKLSQFRNITTRHFNIAKEDMEQNVEEGFDLVLVAGLDDDQDMHMLLRRLRSLTKINGRLVVLEARSTESEWQQALMANAFSGVDIALDQGEDFSRIIVSQAVSIPALPKSVGTCVYVLYEDSITPFHQALADEFSRRRIIPIVATLADAARVPKDSRVIMALELEGGLIDVSEVCYNSIKALARNVSSLLWLTKGDILRGHEPSAAIATGLMRVLSSEVQESRFAVFHLEASSVGVPVTQVCEQEIRLAEGDAELETEVALYNGVIHIPRLVYDSGLSSTNAQTASTVTAPIHSQGPMRVDFATPGLISSAYFKPDESLDGQLPEGWIEIKTSAIGLNWKDVVMTSGRSTSRMDLDSCSYECAGIVVACSPGLSRFQPGDRVYGLSWSCKCNEKARVLLNRLIFLGFGTHIRTPAGFVQRMKPDESFEQMCTIPLAFCTAIYALVHLGRVKKDDRVLIQTATGGLGLAAIQVAKASGAEVFATAGNPEKRAYLQENCGIPQDHIFSSREEFELTSMMTATSGKGFNIVLSTSSGDMMHATWKCIASRGHLIDVARVDVIDHTVISMEVFERNATFSSFDFSIMMKEEPEFCSS